MEFIWILVGLVILVVGGELLVRYASRLAIAAGVSPLVVGLTVVAFGTSAPELITSVYGRLAGESAVALGNVVGSNILNVLLILGVSALVAPLSVNSRLLRVEVPAGVVVSLVAAGFAFSGTIGAVESSVLLAASVVYTVWLIVQSRRETSSVVEEYTEGIGPDEEEGGHWAVSVLLVLVGLGLLIVGGRLFVSGAVGVATELGVSEAVIGLTVVAVGTSLPELVTSVLATIRGQRDIAVGNVVGSNLFNLTVVLGFAGLVGSEPMEVPARFLVFDMVVMIAVAVLCFPLMFTGRRLDRWEGGVLVLYYAAYVVYLVLQSTGHLAAPRFAEAVLYFGLPLSLLTLGVIGYRELREEP